MTTPICEYCERPYSDARGCEYLPEDARPKPYGSELYPLSDSDRCRDCAAPKGTLHHAQCLCSECRVCDGQFGICGGIDCEAARELVTGGMPA